jgi:predicted ester cyclase
LRLRDTLRVRGMTIFRLADGKIIEEWTSFDQYALLTQLGLIPE